MALIYFQATVSWDAASSVLTTKVVPCKSGAGKKQTVTRKIVNNELVMVTILSVLLTSAKSLRKHAHVIYCYFSRLLKKIIFR